MKEYTNRVSVHLINSATAMSDYEFLCDYFDYRPNVVSADGTQMNEVKLQLTTDADLSTRTEMLFPRQAIVTLHASDGTTVTLGSGRFPVSASIIPHLSRCRLIVNGTVPL